MSVQEWREFVKQERDWEHADAVEHLIKGERAPVRRGDIAWAWLRGEMDANMFRPFESSWLHLVVQQCMDQVLGGRPTADQSSDTTVGSAD